MYEIGFTLIIIGGCLIESENMAIPVIFILPGAVLITAKYLLDKKRTHRSGNFYKFK